MYNVFIDGQVGTTGLKIVDRLKDRQDVSLMEIPYDKRKDLEEKKKYLNSADLVILCLPDKAAKESVAMISNKKVKVLDASTAHRVDPEWTYGLPELSKDQREKIQTAKFVSVPGCYPTGFILETAPLIKSGIIPTDCPVTVNAVSGYSGGGRQMIEKYQEKEKEFPGQELWSYRPYGMQLAHKHVPEMKLYSGLRHEPLFIPAVGHFHQGMLVSVPLFASLLRKGTTAKNVHEVLSLYYEMEPFINVHPLNDMDRLRDGFLSPLEC
ncbi:N-acetyl-gamma-glutamyl-phosphate reductase, partial [bacterium]|nr:N-acetyl-gamma-glutamyl-phosphate reductase [bacterium]